VFKIEKEKYCKVLTSLKSKSLILQGHHPAPRIELSPGENFVCRALKSVLPRFNDTEILRAYLFETFLEARPRESFVEVLDEKLLVELDLLALPALLLDAVD